MIQALKRYENQVIFIISMLLLILGLYVFTPAYSFFFPKGKHLEIQVSAQTNNGKQADYTTHTHPPQKPSE